MSGLTFKMQPSYYRRKAYICRDGQFANAFIASNDDGKLSLETIDRVFFEAKELIQIADKIKEMTP